MSIATPRPAVRIPMPKNAASEAAPTATAAPSTGAVSAPTPATPTPVAPPEVEEVSLSCYFWPYSQDETTGQAVREEIAKQCANMKRTQQFKIFTIYEGNPDVSDDANPVWCVAARNVFEAHKYLNEKRLNYFARIDKPKRGRRKTLEEMLNEVTPEQAKALIAKLAQIAG